MPAPSTCPLVVTVKFNGKVIAERTTMQIGVASSWESVARTRLEAVLPPETVADYMGAGLKVHLFESAAHLPSQRVAAQISDPVSGGFTLGYAHVVLAFEALQYGPIRPPQRVDAAARMMGTAQRQAATLDLPKPYAAKEDGSVLNFELRLYNAIWKQCSEQGLGVKACDLASCHELLLGTRDAVWLTSGREGDFKWTEVLAPKT